ncbi:MAG: hypothetical protein E6Q59_01365 [Nitrosomonas sp.]|nr:hypothetical protein [Nitrosomonas sp.]OQW82041.1 MAG: hypothetical protein BVN30_09755 [Proteobacteria bacterium ST_bin16]TXI42017.1 MAG: hypothetical protein E6Q59_01365 [Nitrosomonas sp.]
MNATDLKSARAARAELLTKRGKFDQKKRDCKNLAANISAKLSGLEKAHLVLEKQYLSDEADLSQVSASRQELDAKRAELVEAERLSGLASEAILEIDQQINVAAQNFRNAKIDFCFQVRDEKLAKIKGNQELRELLLAAISAHASNGFMMYTYDPRKFVELFITQILPEISEDQAREAVEKFKKENSLED